MRSILIGYDVLNFFILLSHKLLLKAKFFSSVYIFAQIVAQQHKFGSYCSTTL